MTLRSITIPNYITPCYEAAEVEEAVAPLRRALPNWRHSCPTTARHFFGLRPPLFDARQNIRHDFRLRLRALRAAGVQAHGNHARVHVATADDESRSAGWILVFSTPTIFGFIGSLLKSETTRTCSNPTPLPNAAIFNVRASRFALPSASKIRRPPAPADVASATRRQYYVRVSARTANDTPASRCGQRARPSPG